jgi:hypothetical protein
MRGLVRGGLVLVVLLVGQAQAELILYDGALNTTPDQQGWAYLTSPLFGAEATQSASGGRTTLDTTPDAAEMAGYFLGGPFGSPALAPVLDRLSGFSLSFDARLDAESHASGDRAGFSVIVLSSDRLGIELGFWSDEVWAQADDPLFAHGEGAALDTTRALARYELRVLGTAYTLSADGVPLLSGALRDYTAFAGFPDPYEIPNLLFLGDNTSSASARVEIARVSVSFAAVPEPSSLMLLIPCLAGLRRRRDSQRRAAVPRGASRPQK